MVGSATSVDDKVDDKTAAKLSPEAVRSILQNFKKLKYIGLSSSYGEGRSGAIVLLGVFVYDRGHAHKPKTVRLVVKIDSYASIVSERQGYREARQDALKNMTAKWIDDTLHIQGDFAAVALELAHNTFAQSLTLRELLKKPHQKAAIPLYVEKVVHCVAKWSGGDVERWVNLSPPAMVWSMLADKVERIFPRIYSFLPGLDLNCLFFSPDIWDTDQLPNPLAFLRATHWKELSPATSRRLLARYPCPVGRVFGDLNTNNILCFPMAPDGFKRTSDLARPVLIDYNDVRACGYPLFDLAYLELDILLHSLDLSQQDDRGQWLYVCRQLTDSLLLDRQLLGLGGLHMLIQSVVPARSEAFRLIYGTRAPKHKARNGRNAKRTQYSADLEFAWWAAMIAVGLDFCSKRTLSDLERIACLLYASYALRKLLQPWQSQLKLPATQTSVPRLRWFYALQQGGAFNESEELQKLVRTVSIHIPRPFGRISGLSSDGLGSSGDLSAPLEWLQSAGYSVTTCAAAESDTCCTCSVGSAAQAIVIVVDDLSSDVARIIEAQGWNAGNVLLMIRNHNSSEASTSLDRYCMIPYDGNDHDEDFPFEEPHEDDCPKQRHHLNDLESKYFATAVQHWLLHRVAQTILRGH